MKKILRTTSTLTEELQPSLSQEESLIHPSLKYYKFSSVCWICLKNDHIFIFKGVFHMIIGLTVSLATHLPLPLTLTLLSFDCCWVKGEVGAELLRYWHWSDHCMRDSLHFEKSSVMTWVRLIAELMWRYHNRIKINYNHDYYVQIHGSSKFPLVRFLRKMFCFPGPLIASGSVIKRSAWIGTKII